MNLRRGEMAPLDVKRWGDGNLKHPFGRRHGVRRSRRRGVRRGLVLGSVVAALLAAVGSPGVAAAAVRTVKLIQTEMHIVGYDAAVAESHGYEIRTMADGRQYSAKKGTSPTDVTTQGEVFGSCGSSWLYETAQGNLSVYLETGFSVYTGVVGLQWNVTLTDGGGSSNVPYPSRSSSGYWVHNKTIGGLTAGRGTSVVVPGSFAQLIDGAICYSGSPSSGDIIY
jgi:hypothetical protein